MPIIDVKSYTAGMSEIAGKLETLELVLQELKSEYTRELARYDGSEASILTEQLETFSAWLAELQTNSKLWFEVEQVREQQAKENPKLSSEKAAAANDKKPRCVLSSSTATNNISMSRGPAESVATRSKSQQPHLADMMESVPKSREPAQYLSPMTEYDLADLPKYIVGRMTVDKLNRSIAALNQYIHDRERIRRIPQSKIPRDLKERFYAIQESFEVFLRKPEPEDIEHLVFVTDVDIKLHPKNDFKLDNVGRSVMNILRSAKRIKEVRGGGFVRYMVQ